MASHFAPIIEQLEKKNATPETISHDGTVTSTTTIPANKFVDPDYQAILDALEEEHAAEAAAAMEQEQAEHTDGIEQERPIVKFKKYRTLGMIICAVVVVTG